MQGNATKVSLRGTKNIIVMQLFPGETYSYGTLLKADQIVDLEHVISISDFLTIYEKYNYCPSTASQVGELGSANL